MRWGSSEIHERTLGKTPSRSRKRCSCGCQKRSTHTGLANGICLTSGCELLMRRWVRDGYPKHSKSK